VKTNQERDVRIWGEKLDVLSAFHWIIHMCHLLNGRADHKCAASVVHTVTSKYKGNNQEEQNIADW